MYVCTHGCICEVGLVLLSIDKSSGAKGGSGRTKKSHSETSNNKPSTNTTDANQPSTSKESMIEVLMHAKEVL